MKKRFTFKSAAIMAAVLCLTTVTVFAATHVGEFISSSSSKPTYTSFPTETELQKDLGFVPNTVNTFSNKYTFHDAVIGTNTPVGEDGKKMGDYKFISYTYVFDKEKKVNLYVNKKLPGETIDPKAVKTDYKGLTLSYTSQKYKFVPADYKLTEEDKKAETSGEIEFSYGSDKVENNIVQNIVWTDNGISYNLMASDSNLTQADLTAMAKEIVDKSK
ncbi:MAG TPA: hypothetical protein VHP54_04350 [Caproiciproducens sp.]|nr:hypothetical protein [Caproiciproducens sp.]